MVRILNCDLKLCKCRALERARKEIRMASVGSLDELTADEAAELGRANLKRHCIICQKAYRMQKIIFLKAIESY